MGYQETLLVDAVGVRALDCMGTKVSVRDVCLKDRKYKMEPFVRGYLDTKNNQVVCQFGRAALLALSCESDKTRKYCRSPQKSCLQLKEKYAGELMMSHHSRLFKGDQEILHCYFKEAKTAQKTKEEEVNIPDELTF